MSKRTVGAILIVGALFLATVTPVAASTGTVGAYSLNDSASSPGATGKYKYVVMSDPGENHWQLKRLVVQPPNMMAVDGKSHQMVGWSFTVQRIECFEPPCYWENRYTSPVFQAFTSDSVNADFGQASVSVRVPTQTAGLFHYRVIVKMFWYRPNGSVQGSAKAKVHYYKVVSGDASVVEDACPGGIYN